jgi:hypothetical protein
MSLNPHVTDRDALDAMREGMVREWYDKVNSSLKRSEVLPGSYTTHSAPAVEGIGEIKEGAFIRFNIVADKYRLISLVDSYITFNQRLKIRIPKFDDGVAPNQKAYIRYYAIGYELSVASVKMYRIASGTTTFASVTHANFEHKLMYNSFSDEAIENNDGIANIKNVREMNPQSSLIYIDVGGIDADRTIEVDIPVKIPLSQFILFSNLKWIADWKGKLRLEIMPSYENIVIAPVIPESTFIRYPNINNEMNLENNLVISDDPMVDFGFHQLNQKMRNRFAIVGDTVTILEPQTWECNTQTTSMAYIHLASCQLRESVSLELREEFKNVPLLFPIQTVTSTQFSGQIGGVRDPVIDATLTTKLTCVNNIYVFFLESNATSTQRFTNPMIDYHLLINGALHPQNRYKTVDCPRHYHQTLDALNYNGSHSTSIPKDLRTSIQPYTRIVNHNGVPSIMWNTGTRSNFFIVIPFCDTNMFQGGMSTGDTQVTLKAGRLSETKMKHQHYDQAWLVTTSECYLKIRSEPPIEGGGQIEIIHATLDQLAPQRYIIKNIFTFRLAYLSIAIIKI